MRQFLPKRLPILLTITLSTILPGCTNQNTANKNPIEHEPPHSNLQTFESDAAFNSWFQTRKTQFE